MGEFDGFKKYKRKNLEKEPAEVRKKHFREFTDSFDKEAARVQGARCMDCGVPFCHNGCPLGNLIPEFNNLVSEKNFEKALEVLLSTNNFPEFTGRICPAPCETACVLGLTEDPISIESIEMTLADMGFENGWIKPFKPSKRTGKKVDVIGSGPAGLAAADQLNKEGHMVTVFEKADRPGGLLMYGIPNFKLGKEKVLRRIKLMEESGIAFRCSVNVGNDITLEELSREYDAVLLACGAGKKRDVSIPGRDAKGIYFAEQYLNQATKLAIGDYVHESEIINAFGQDVIVIGGGDTGSDCVGTANRQGANSITQFEIMPMPPSLPKYPRKNQRPIESPWPQWTNMLRTSTSHEEGGSRHWSMESVEFVMDKNGNLESLVTRELLWYTDEKGARKYEVVTGSEKMWPCQLVFIAVGFTGAEISGINKKVHIELDNRGNVKANDIDYKTNIQGVFAAGDMRRGQSLVVWAIAEGRKAASAISEYLKNV